MCVSVVFRCCCCCFILHSFWKQEIPCFRLLIFYLISNRSVDLVFRCISQQDSLLKHRDIRCDNFSRLLQRDQFTYYIPILLWFVVVVACFCILFKVHEIFNSPNWIWIAFIHTVINARKDGTLMFNMNEIYCVLYSTHVRSSDIVWFFGSNATEWKKEKWKENHEIYQKVFACRDDKSVILSVNPPQKEERWKCSYWFWMATPTMGMHML